MLGKDYAGINTTQQAERRDPRHDHERHSLGPERRSERQAEKACLYPTSNAAKRKERRDEQQRR